MASKLNIAVVVGSLRKDSFSRKIAAAAAELAPSNLSFAFVEIGDLPFYNQDLETSTPPAAWTRYREAIASADAVLFVTPEYNRSVPGVLKNAIDVGSRPYGKASLTGKPAGVISTSMGALGGFGANHHLRQSLVFLDMATMAQPEAYVGGTGGLFNADGQLTNDKTRDFLVTWMASFAAFVARQRTDAAMAA